MGNPNIANASVGIGDSAFSPKDEWRNGGSATHYAGDTMNGDSWQFTPSGGGGSV